MQNGGSTWAFGCSVPVARQPLCLAKDCTQALRGVVGFRGVGCFPVPWQQRVQFVPLGPSGHDAFEHVGQPSQRIDIVQLRRLDEGGDDCPMPAAAVGAGEEDNSCVYGQMAISGIIRTFELCAVHPAGIQ